eukprot:COSAG04_NODE_1899_length_5275_cov_29.229907_6_plen_219_part_00
MDLVRCSQPPSYVMTIDSTGLPEPIAKIWVMQTFLVSNDLTKPWNQLDPNTHRYTDHEYTGCSTIRHFAGWFYLAACFSPCCGNAPIYQYMMVRSRNLKDWSGPALPALPQTNLNTTLPGFSRNGNGTKFNPFLSPLFDVANDKRISPGTNLTVEQMQNIDAATDISNSDMDWSDDGKGGVYISYGWSNQNSFANMFLAAAEVRNATQRQWLESFFER